MSTRMLRKVIQEEVGRSLRRATVKAVHGDTVNVQVGGSPKYLRGLPVVGGVDNVVAGDTVVLYEADGRIYAEATKAKAGRRYGNKSGAAVAAVMGPHTHLASSSGGVLSSYVRVDDADTITAQHSFSPSSPQAPFLLGGHAQAQVVVGLRADQLNKSVLAGSGLSGGGVLTADRTLTVDLTHIFNWSGLHTFGAGVDISGTLEFQGEGVITSLSSSSLYIQPTGHVIFNPTSDYLLPNVGYDINIGMLSRKYLTLHCAELWVETLVAQDTIATIGGRILVGPTTVLAVDLGSGVGCTTITVKHNEMAVGDRVYMEAATKVEFMAITAGPNGTGPYTYTVTRDLDGTGRNEWYAGDAIFNTGTTGEGFIDLYSIHGVKASAEHGPAIVGNVRLSTTYNDWAEHWAVGNLHGIYGYTATTYGLAAGKFADSCAWVSVDATNGFRVMYGATSPYALAQWDMSGNILVGRTGSGQSNVYVSAGKLELRNNTTAAITLAANGAVTINKHGDMFFSAADGLLLLGPNCEINDSEWWSLRRQKAIITGAFHQEAGRWLGTRALVIETGTTNLHTNPSVETNTTGWSGAYRCSIARSQVYARFGSYSCKITTGDPATDWFARLSGTGTDGIGVSSSTGYTITVWVYPHPGHNIATHLEIQEYNGAGGHVGQGGVSSDSGVGTGKWERLTCTFTTAETTAYLEIRLRAKTGVDGAGCHLYADGVQVEMKGQATTYCDGSLGHEYTWSGTAHASTSTRVGTTVLVPTAGSIEAAEGYVAMWFKVPVWKPGTSVLWSAGNVNAEFDALVSSDGGIVFRINAGGVCWTAAGTVTKDVWHFAVFNWKVATNESELFLDGVSVDTGTCGDTPTLDTNLGIGYSPKIGLNYNLNGPIAEFAVGGTVLSASEVAAIHALQRPLVDAGAMDAPGIYILDGKFRITSSLTGAHIEITPDYIAGYSDATTKTFYIEASTGIAMGAGGKWRLDEDGQRIRGTTTAADTRKIRWVYDDANDDVLGALYGAYSSVYVVDSKSNAHLWLTAQRMSGDAWADAAVSLDASDYVSSLTGYLDVFASQRVVSVGDNLFLGVTTYPVGASDYGGGRGVFSIRNANTVPTSNPSWGGLLYSQGGAGKWRGSGGTVTTFGPAEPHCPVCGRDFVLEWENGEWGTHLQVCMWCLIEVLGAKMNTAFVLKKSGPPVVARCKPAPNPGSPPVRPVAE